MQPNFGSTFNTNMNFLPIRNFPEHSLPQTKDYCHQYRNFQIPPLMQLQSRNKAKLDCNNYTALNRMQEMMEFRQPAQSARALIKTGNQNEFSFNRTESGSRPILKPGFICGFKQDFLQNVYHGNYQYREHKQDQSAQESALSPVLGMQPAVQPAPKTCLPVYQKGIQNESKKGWNTEASSSNFDQMQNKFSKQSSSAEHTLINDAMAAVSNNLLLDVCGSTQIEKMFIFTGTVERVIKWNKIFCNHFCHYEVIGFVISIQEGNISQQKIMLLRDKKGPVLQLIYYETTHIDIEDFYVGKILRCVGKMIGPNVMNAFTIRSARDTEVEILERLCLICDQAISYYLKV